ncbi:MAG: non-homologous end-joining DNA ligase [Thermoanaerobaculia bacterium]
MKRIEIPHVRDVNLKIGGKVVSLTNLDKPFWKNLGLAKRDLLQYYADMADVLAPHLANRAMVMKRYPNGAAGEFFYMKRTPDYSPEWIEQCVIPHNAGPVNFPIVNDLASLLWIVNLGCIDLNPWYARCDDWDRPDFLHFDLDPGPGSGFAEVRETALRLRDLLSELGIGSSAKTSGSKGIHMYVPIRRGPLQKEVWTVAKAVAIQMESMYPKLVTAEYRKVNRPHGRVLVDYNQNAWGRTLASIYSVRPTPEASVSMPVTWEEVENGVEIADFTLFNARDRIVSAGDLWKPLLQSRGRVDLEKTFARTTIRKSPAAVRKRAAAPNKTPKPSARKK